MRATLALTLTLVASASACGSKGREGSDRGATSATSTTSAPTASATGSARAAGPLETARTGPFVEYEIRDAATGALMPGKLSFVGVSGTKTPAFSSSDIPREEDQAIAAYSRVMSLRGDGRVAVPAGTYDVYVSRGIEWSLDVHRGVTVGPEDGLVVAKLTHEVPTPGWLSADFHVHAASSFDSRVPMTARVFEFVSDGVDLIVSTDHNVVADYAPLIRDLGASDLLASMHGDELTTRDWGHFGAFPLPLDESRKDGGAPTVKNRTPKQIFGDVRKLQADAIINVNHPRFDRGMGYFSTGILDPRSARAGRPGFSFDFDAVEVLNGYQDGDHLHVDRVLRDWFSLLSHGYLVTATGNSDTHHLDYNLGGYPRNYVRVAHDDPGHASGDEVTRAVHDHQAFFTTGPMIDLTIEGAGIGELARAAPGTIAVHVVVRAASWIATDRLSIYVGGKLVVNREIGAKRDVVRLDESIPVRIERDTFVVARVDGAEPLPPVVGDPDERFEVLPLAVTNPVFVDANGNGRFDPPKAP